MAAQQSPLSKEALVQFNESTDSAGLASQRRRASISTRRSSQSREPFTVGPNMAAQQSPLSKEALVQFNESTDSAGLASQRRRASISTRRSSQSREPFTSSVLSKRFSFGGWLPAGMTSFSGLPLHQPPLQKLENTYRTEPEQQCRFKTSRVRELIQAVLESHLDGAQYNDSCSHLGPLLADMLRGKVKEITPPRYKLVCQVVIGQRKNQCVRVASGCLWDDQLDNVSVAEFQNHSLYAVAIVHGVYFE